MSAALALALLAFFPHLKPEQARTYATAFVTEGRRAGVDPLVAASRAWVESGFRERAYEPVDRNHGLMQVRRKIWEPKANILEGVRVLAYWKRWHAEGRCRQAPRHPYWLHYTWGYVVPPKRRTPRRWKMDRVRLLLKRHMSRRKPVATRGRVSTPRPLCCYIPRQNAGTGPLRGPRRRRCRDS